MSKNNLENHIYELRIMTYHCQKDLGGCLIFVFENIFLLFENTCENKYG